MAHDGAQHHCGGKLDEICTILEPVKDKPEEFHATLNKLLQNIIKKHKRILFSGDGYGEAG